MNLKKIKNSTEITPPKITTDAEFIMIGWMIYCIGLDRNKLKFLVRIIIILNIPWHNEKIKKYNSDLWNLQLIFSLKKIFGLNKIFLKSS